ncbi:MAG: hypothetical protein EOM50_10460 [Erysipelotrichia bacterium]|nr:hypothetical protein [Erysipelotrichia bacterium]
MQSKLKRIASPKIIKNHFMLYYSTDHHRVLREMYTKASSLLVSSKGFYISADHLSQSMQLQYLALAQHGIEFSKFENDKLLKKELQLVSKSLSDYLGVVEFSNKNRIRKESLVGDIKTIAKEVDFIFIESFRVNSTEDLTMLHTIKELAHELLVRIEIGIVCSQEWLNKTYALTSNICVLV